MIHLRLLLSLSVLVVACGDKDTTTEPATEPATSGAQTTGGDTTAAEAGTTVEAPTTGDDTTGVVGPTTGEPMTTTGGSTEVVVEMASSMCDEQNPGMVPPALAAEVSGAGAIKVTEMGFETSCCLDLDPQVAVEGMALNVSYTEVGEPCDCICYYTIDFVVSGLTSGSWTVVSGAQSVDVEVP